MQTTSSDILTVKDIQSYFHIGKNSAYQLMNSAGFPTFRINNRMFVERQKLSEWVSANTGHTYLT